MSSKPVSKSTTAVSAPKAAPKCETFYRIVRKSTYEYALEAVEVDVNSISPKAGGTPDILRNVINQFAEKIKHD